MLTRKLEAHQYFDVLLFFGKRCENVRFYHDTLPTYESYENVGVDIDHKL